MTDRADTPATIRKALEAARAAESFHAEMSRSFRLEAEGLERRLALAEAGTLLTVAPMSRKPGGNMVTDRRLAISEGRTGKDRFAAAYRAKGYTLRSLAEKVGCSHPLLSRCRKSGGEPIARRWADKIATLIDWPADKAHWANGIS